MRPSNLAKLAELAKLKALRAAQDLAGKDALAAPIRSALADLKNDDSEIYAIRDANDIFEMHRKLAFQAWKKAETRELQMALARHEVSLAPLQRQFAYESAREKVLCRLVTQSDPKARAGRST